MPNSTQDTACCGLSLKAASVIILWMFIVGGGLTILMGLNEILGLHYIRFGLFKYFPWYDVVSGMAIMISGIIGVHGINVEEHNHLLPFLWCCCSFIVLGITQMIFVFHTWPILVEYLEENYEMDELTENFARHFIFFAMICNILAHTLAIYCVFVVFSYYKMLKRTSQQRNRANIT